MGAEGDDPQRPCLLDGGTGRYALRSQRHE
jgi:hypothetical protein